MLLCLSAWQMFEIKIHNQPGEVLSQSQLALLQDSVLLISAKWPCIQELAPTRKSHLKATGQTSLHPALKGS